ncbi:hypothetical protein J2S43_006311 [Catenuloplanes nepalensis]|uniref:Glycosyltransferase family 1 protein n=1 Tax=Catenuloplanes nepalensis TaxID=587533 RepID=A0ABT9N275_9ACTN|nr:hypothetical protein [Catenuloplanes nepalensis]MDP9797799.1 hypothetical protein [Catenuloplanes nepalensis]
MHHANHFYGHAHVLARYCGLDDANPPRIAGYLQHGWNIGDGLGEGTRLVAGRPTFAWSEATARRARLAGRPAVVIGAPFAYLIAHAERVLAAERPRLAPPELSAPPPGDMRRTGTIWYPFHGWEKQKVRGDHDALIDAIRSVETEPVTVCLYWQDHDDRRVRGRYERAGFRVICHGRRGLKWRGTDPRFLDRQLAELRGHRRVASNRLSTAIFHGIAAGCEPAVYGDPMTLTGEDPRYGGHARVRRQWSALHGERIDPRTAREAARTELGLDHLAGPDELRDLLGWPQDSPLPAPATPDPRATRVRS